MTTTEITALNRQFSCGENISVHAGHGGLACLQLHHNQAFAEVYLQGAHITAYQPAGGKNLLWMSQSAQFHPGKALRGGIPLCWPWFGPNPQIADRPQHGFARTTAFELCSAEADTDSTRVTLRLNSKLAPFPEWQSVAEVTLEIRLSDHLWMELHSTNLSTQPIRLGSAMHSYFAVDDVRQTRIDALRGLSYLDKTQNARLVKQSQDFSVSRATDRVYLDAPNRLNLLTSDQKLSIENWGCADLVVWNPWLEQAAQMTDFDDQGYLKMLCIEPANVLDNVVRLNPGETHVMGQKLKIDNAAK